jgi:Zn-finger nucleic acid-binding protein
MPLPIPQPVQSYPSNSTLFQPYYVRESQRYAVDQERQRHAQALYSLGEWTMFCLMWHIQDYKNGLVGLCPVCSESRDALAYQQPQRNHCPNCFGTTFDGGYKALIVRQAIFADTDEGQAFQARGVVNSDDLDMESTPDFRVRSGDYCFRSTGDRFYLRVPQRVTLRTGFATPYQRDMAVGYNHARASMEDPSTVCYTIPPATEDLVALLSVHSTEPVSFAQFEVIRAPLIPIDDLG